jgi:ribosomal protein S18 acetylase RimI-like enzyme
MPGKAIFKLSRWFRSTVGRVSVEHSFARSLRRRQLVELAMFFLEVRADNDAAVALYESEGFEAIDRRVGYYQPDGVDAIVMRLQSL